jgi:hypothetical protein
MFEMPVWHLRASAISRWEIKKSSFHKPSEPVSF